MKYSTSELRNLGLSDEQIAAINRIYRAEQMEDKVITMPAVDVSEAVRKVKDIPVGPLLESKSARVYGDADVVDFNKLVKISDSRVVELPEFGDGTKFIARLRRPSMLKLCKSGKIPNSLLSQATSLFTDDKASKKVGITEIYDICEIICEAAFVVPTYNEIKESGVELTDEQIMAVFQYAQGGVKALENFRNE